ncbi:hypothetical protein BCR36DRAFT_415295 [Piromyces finnis]|uniref:Scaffoldin n=1 Tax=Piromyces finnis TaxID=1754191 RepID=A0A1Y1V0T4_9FUNG|nr:hypothetical protein BCR36DRAFT_415295 [Piromyces finnis]|eukprot:ORX43939.1 hypothetical protein BCR36DRAFT_415295 [Piromyces finnis]
MFAKKLLSVVSCLFLGSQLISVANADAIELPGCSFDISGCSGSIEASSEDTFCIGTDDVIYKYTDTECNGKLESGVYVFDKDTKKIPSSVEGVDESKLVMYDCDSTCAQINGYAKIGSSYYKVLNDDSSNDEITQFDDVSSYLVHDGQNAKACKNDSESSIEVDTSVTDEDYCVDSNTSKITKRKVQYCTAGVECDDYYKCVNGENCEKTNNSYPPRGTGEPIPTCNPTSTDDAVYCASGSVVSGGNLYTCSGESDEACTPDESVSGLIVSAEDDNLYTCTEGKDCEITDISGYLIDSKSKLYKCTSGADCSFKNSSGYLINPQDHKLYQCTGGADCEENSSIIGYLVNAITNGDSDPYIECAATSTEGEHDCDVIEQPSGTCTNAGDLIYITSGGVGRKRSVSYKVCIDDETSNAVGDEGSYFVKSDAINVFTDKAVAGYFNAIDIDDKGNVVLNTVKDKYKYAINYKIYAKGASEICPEGSFSESAKEFTLKVVEGDAVNYYEEEATQEE